MFQKLFRHEGDSELLQRAIDNVSGMLRHEKKMLAAASAYLFEGTVPSIDIRLLDKDVNVEERMIRRLVFEHLTFIPASDLTEALVLVSIVHDVERIGDYAKGIQGLVETYGQMPVDLPAGRRMVDLKDAVMGVYELSRAAFEDDDSEKAGDCLKRHRANEKASKEIVRMVARDDGLAKNPAILISSAARMYRRVSAHLTNIASSVTNPFDRIGGPLDESV